MAKITYSNVSLNEIFWVNKCLKFALKYLGQPKNLQVFVNFVDKDTIKQLNQTNRNIDSPTDVLSFPYLNLSANEVINPDNFSEDINVKTGNLLLGEIYLCHDIAIEQAAEYGHSLKREVSFLCLHSLLHLLGYDHQDEKDREQMENLQEEILSKLGVKR